MLIPALILDNPQQFSLSGRCVRTNARFGTSAKPDLKQATLLRFVNFHYGFQLRSQITQFLRADKNHSKKSDRYVCHLVIHNYITFIFLSIICSIFALIYSPFRTPMFSGFQIYPTAFSNLVTQLKLEKCFATLGFPNDTSFIFSYQV